MALFFTLCLGLMISLASACYPIHSGFYAGRSLYLTHGPHYFALPNGEKERHFGRVSHLFGLNHAPDAALSCAMCHNQDPGLIFHGPSFYKYIVGSPLQGPFSSGLIHPTLVNGIDAAAYRGGFAHFFQGCNFLRAPTVGYGPMVQGYLPSIGLPCHLDAAWEQGPHMILVKGPQSFIWPSYAVMARPYALAEKMQVVSRPVCPASKVYVIVQNKVIDAKPKVVAKKATEPPTEPPTTLKTGDNGEGGIGAGGFNVGGKKVTTTNNLTNKVSRKYSFKKHWSPRNGGTLKCVYKEYKGGELVHTEEKEYHYTENTSDAVDQLKDECREHFASRKEPPPKDGGRFSYGVKTIDGKKYLVAKYKEYKDGQEIRSETKTYELPEVTDDEKNEKKAEFRKYVGVESKTKVENVGPQGRITWTKNFHNGKGELKVKFHEMKDGKEIGVKTKTYAITDGSDAEIKGKVKEFADELGIASNADIPPKGPKVISNVTYKKTWVKGKVHVMASYKAQKDGKIVASVEKEFILDTDDKDAIVEKLAEYKNEQDALQA